MTARDEADINFAPLVGDIQAWNDQADHQTGTAGDLLTSQILVNRLRGVPLVATITQNAFQRRVPVNGWVTGKGFQVEGLPLFDSPTTPTEGISGSLANIKENGEIGVGVLGSGGADPSDQDFYRSRRNKRFKPS